MADVDVLIAGAGPAGCATAIALADFAPELRVCLADAPPGREWPIGESVPPAIEPLLRHLGVWQTFAAAGHRASYRMSSAWGGPQLGSNEYLLQAHQVGWQVDRARFDAMLRAVAVRRVAVAVTARVTELAHADGRWRVTCGDGARHAARFVVDATGRGAAPARAQSLRPARLDRLVGCFVHVADRGDARDGPVIEAFADGWWYTAAVPGGRRVVACMSDADVLRRLRLVDPQCLLAALRGTRHVAAAAAGARPLGAPQVRAAGSQIVRHDAALPLLGVGDAASCFDPVSGQGIVKALRSGIFAAYAIADWLRGGDATGLRRYRALVASEFAAYRATLRDYYAIEQRWPERPFWRRRQENAGYPVRK